MILPAPPRQQRPVQAGRRDADRRRDRERRLARAHEALDQAGEHQPRHRPEHDLDRRARLAPQRRAARERPWVDDRPAEPQPRHAADRDAGELEQTVREDEPQQHVERAVLDRQAQQSADEAAVEDRQRGAAEAEHDAARDGQERDLDVVCVDLARQPGLLARRQVAGARVRVRGALELARDDAERGRRVVDRPDRGQRHRDEQQGDAEAEHQRPFEDPPPVAGGHEAPKGAPPRLGGVDGLARLGHEPLEQPRDRVAGEQPARERQIGCGGAIAAAEPQQRLRAQPLGPRTGLAHERGKLVPARLAFPREAIDVHRLGGV